MRLKQNLLIFLFITILIVGSVDGAIHLKPKMTKSPADLTYELGSVGNELIWQFDAHERDDSPTTYTVTIDTVDLAGHTDASWQDNVDIIVSVDGLDLGDHVVEITVLDNGVEQNLAPPAIDEAIVSVTSVGSGESNPSGTTSTGSNVDETQSSDDAFFPFVSLTIGFVILSVTMLIKKSKKNHK